MRFAKRLRRSLAPKCAAGVGSSAAAPVGGWPFPEFLEILLEINMSVQILLSRNFRGNKQVRRNSDLEISAEINWSRGMLRLTLSRASIMCRIPEL